MPKLNARNVNSENDIKGQQRPATGKYHMGINFWDETMKDGDYIRVDLQVLAGTVVGQEGRTIQEKLFLSEKAIDRLTRFCLAAKLIKPGEEIDRDLSEEAMNKQLIVEIVPHKYTNKEGREVETVQCAFMGFWSLENPEVAEVPKNAAAIQLLGGSTNGPSSPTAAPTTGTAAASEWSSLVV